MEKIRTQPVRVRLDMTIPVGMKRRLQKASTLHGVDMTRIVEGLLDEHLPKLLRDEQSGSLFGAD